MIQTLFPVSLPSKPTVLAAAICRSVRHAVSKTPNFREGAIAIRFVSKSLNSHNWLFGTNDFMTPEDDIDVDFMFSAVPSAPKTRPAGWNNDSGNLEVACAGCVMLRLEACAYAVSHNLGRCSENLPEMGKAYGRDEDPGAVCYDIFYTDDNFLIPSTLADQNRSSGLLLRIYIGVHGAEFPAQDKKCALAAGQTILRSIQNDAYAANLRLVMPGTDAMRRPAL